jgi:ADP-heptose:LPS heptosyltransferase
MQDVAFYSLQPGAAADVAAARAAGLPLTDYTAEFASFDHTAALVSELDLVITVCTSAAHLGGALGQRTWVLLDVNPHWVWLLERSDSPWYPSARLYRQPRFGEWEPALQAMAHDLRILAAQHRAAQLNGT